MIPSPFSPVRAAWQMVSDRLFHVVVAEHDVDLDAGQHDRPVGAGSAGELDATLPAVPAHSVHVHAHDADRAGLP